MGARSTSGNHDNVLKADGHLLEFLRSSFGFGGGGTNFDVTNPGIVASGGVISDYTSGSDVYRAHVFTSSGTFTVTNLGTISPNTVEYLVVAGGGGGGGYADAGGGGGAGGLRTNLSGHPLAGSAFPVSTSPGSYTITVGGGATGSRGRRGLSGCVWCSLVSLWRCLVSS